jgi:hypothetical protein
MKQAILVSGGCSIGWSRRISTISQTIFGEQASRGLGGQFRAENTGQERVESKHIRGNAANEAAPPRSDGFAGPVHRNRARIKPESK